MKQTSSTAKRFAFAMIAVVCLLRLAVCFTSLGSLESDPDSYAAIATQLRETGDYARSRPDGSSHLTAFRPPTYPLLLSLFMIDGKVSPLAVAVCHLLLGWATILLCFLIGKDWARWLLADDVADVDDVTSSGASTPVAVGALAATLCGIDPLLLNQSRLVMTETLAAFFTAVILFCVGKFALAPQPAKQRSKWIWILLAGFTFAVAILCRPLFLIWLGVTLFVLMVQAFRSVDKSAWKSTLLTCSVLLITAMSLPLIWMTRNALVVGQPILTTTHGGYTFGLGNNQSFFAYLQGVRTSPSPTWDASPWQQRLASAAAEREIQNDELAESQLAYELAWQDIVAEPKMFAWACVIRIGRLWSPLPHAESADESTSRRLLRLGVAGYYVCFGLAFCLALLGLQGKLGRFPIPLALGFLLATTLLHSVYWSNIRMRSPLVPVLVCVVGVGVTAYFKTRRKPG